MEKAKLRLSLFAVAVSGVLISTAYGEESKASLGQQFIDGHNAISFSILVPYTDTEKRVENVKVTCDEGKCRVRVESIRQRACGGGMTYPGRGFVPFDEMIQIQEYGADEKDTLFRPKVTPGDDRMLIVQFIDSGQEARLRVLLSWEKSPLPGHEPFITASGVVGEEEMALSPPARYAAIAEIVGSPVICRARFQSR